MTIPGTIVDLVEIAHGEFAENILRKDFTPSEMVAILKAVRPVEEKAAKERQKQSKGRGKKKEKRSAISFS